MQPRLLALPAAQCCAIRVPFPAAGGLSAESLAARARVRPQAVDAPADRDEIAQVTFMQVPSLRESLRSRGLSPAGSRQTLQERLVASLKGNPSDCASSFAPTPSGYDTPGGWIDPGSRPALVAKSSVKVSQPSGGNSQLGYLFGPGASTK